MKVLILSCNTGGGHNSCAKAIGAELLNRGHTYETDDALLYVSKGTSRFVSNWHVRFYRYFPKLYNKGYQYAEEHPASFDESSAACRILRRGCKRLRAAILAGGYDAVVCVHLFPALMLTFIQREAPLPIKTMFIATDYTARLVEAAEKTGADLVISPYTMVIPAGASKPEQVLEKIQDDLGVMHVARPPENREYGFLPEGVYDKDTFARRLMDKPASYFYSVLWNKLYRRDILTRHDIRFTSEMRWAEDLVFNMQYIQYAEVFASIPQPGYYYVQNPQSICHTQIKPATLVQNKIQVFHYYKDLYTRLGMYEQVRPQLYKFLIDIAESTYPSGPFKKVIDEAKAYWKEHRAELEQKL